MTTFWIYDYICSLHEEWTFLLRSRWTEVKTLYITARYIPFLITTMNLYLILAPNENTNISINLITCFFVLRTILLVVMLFTLFHDPGLSAELRQFRILYAVYSLACVPTGVGRSAKGPLYAILVKHNIFYYACGLLLSVVNVIVPVLPLSDSLSYFLPEGFEVFILAILATRMHLHLWHMDQQVHGSDIACIEGYTHRLRKSIAPTRLGKPTFLLELSKHMLWPRQSIFSHFRMRCNLFKYNVRPVRRRLGRLYVIIPTPKYADIAPTEASVRSGLETLLATTWCVPFSDIAEPTLQVNGL
ncbi:uncharacterized protein BJ212DRAFT_1528741 [Suillus subaureus]|uniref:DUF6533 domain-containing protein n=1 Tax=Suillus subaureus TaxID=48587 RepID=A0A9P7E2B0_9AGAM|nr:uncharacterized protein BJ212DRAFT_1528741 [Suillus subaureus]KAG1809141.1 hypothetical protein BJ212DRAFT_1528741 [Suillus subaureus]